MSVRRARILFAAGMSSSLLGGFAVTGSGGATTSDTVAETSVAATPDTDAETSATTPDAAVVEVLPPDESWGGLTRGELTVQWWQRAFTMPDEISPYTDTTGERCGYQQSGPVFILPGSFVGSVERTCVVAEGTAIFVFAGGGTCSTVEPPPYFGRTEDELRECVTTATHEEIAEASVSINGQEVSDLDAYWTTSPLFTITFPEDNIVGIEPGVGQAVSEAMSIIIAPPQPGEYVITGSLRHVWESVPTTNSTTIIVEAPQVIEPPTT
jgi:hypothetical protein